MSESPSKHLCAEFISVAKICEADDITACHRILDHDHCGDCSDLQSVTKERSLLGINLRWRMVTKVDNMMMHR